MQLNPDNTAVVGSIETAWAIIETRNPGQAPVDELDMNLPDPLAFVFKVVHGNLLDLQYQGQHCTLSAAGP